ncbi:hypothetical protein N9A87_02660 [Euryarchaeota archaeon]|nr:hypothetical protein [Euryarchaeota archaeon]
MAGPTFSPDGKWMWTGSEWIPTPPQSDVLPESALDLPNLESTAIHYQVDSQKLAQTAVFFDQNKDGVLQDSEIRQAVNAISNPAPIFTPNQTPQVIVQKTQKASSGFGVVFSLIGTIVVVGIILLLIVNRTLFFDTITEEFSDWDNDGISDANDPDDDNDGYLDENDWYDEGNGGLAITFTNFQIWDEGNYDSGGNPDVYAYVGIGNGDCSGMQYFEYLDDINVDASVLYNWKEYVVDIDDDKTSVCVSITIYDEDSWAPDEILDFVPGEGNYVTHQFVLSSGEGDTTVSQDNRGENQLSIYLRYEISRVAVA